MTERLNRRQSTRRERKTAQRLRRDRAYRWGWYYGRELKAFGEPPKPILYALFVLFLPLAVVVTAVWILVIKPLRMARGFPNGVDRQGNGWGAERDEKAFLNHPDDYLAITGIVIAVGLISHLFIGNAPVRVSIVIICLVVSVATLLMVLLQRDRNG